MWCHALAPNHNKFESYKSKMKRKKRLIHLEMIESPKHLYCVILDSWSWKDVLFFKFCSQWCRVWRPDTVPYMSSWCMQGKSSHLSITVITYTGFPIYFCTFVPLLQSICFDINVLFSLSCRTNSVNINKSILFTMYNKP